METLADDLFAGAGGWELAGRPLGVRGRGVENSQPARRTRLAAGLDTIHDDVWTFEPDGKAEGGIASPPCPTFSQAGPKSGLGMLDQVLRSVRGHDWLSIERLRTLGRRCGDERTALVLTPLHFAMMYPHYRWLAWEQVPTVLPVWEACAARLRTYGWSVWTGVLNAEQYGTGQARRRAVLIASRDHEVTPPTPTHSQFHRHDTTRLDPDVRPWVTMATALGRTDLPAWCSERPATTVVGTFHPEIVAAPGYRTAVSRQDAPDSATVTVAEAGVLQGFPADFPWQGGPKGGQGPAYLQAGNAVPVQLARCRLVCRHRSAIPAGPRADTERVCIAHCLRNAVVSHHNTDQPRRPRA
jgi:DNA (cytosine-5)-methyltransferase 1